MSATQASAADHPEPGRYEIRVKGHLDDRWADWFDGLTIAREDDGNTRLTGAVVDQAALHGLLGKVRDLGLPLIAVTQVDPQPASEPRAKANADTDHTHSTQETNP
jgi:hypothetical protein